MRSPLSLESFFPDVAKGEAASVMEKAWIRVSVRGWLTTQTAAPGTTVSPL